MKDLVGLYPKAKKLRIVLDNLNTHGFHSFYEEFDAETAAWLTQKVEFISSDTLVETMQFHCKTLVS